MPLCGPYSVFNDMEGDGLQVEDRVPGSSLAPVPDLAPARKGLGHMATQFWSSHLSTLILSFLEPFISMFKCLFGKSKILLTDDLYSLSCQFRGLMVLQLKADSLQSDFLGSSIRSITYQLYILD